MGSKELIEALLKEADEKVAKIREDAEAKAEEIRDDLLRNSEGLRREHDKRVLAGEKELAERIIAEAEKKARAIRLSTSDALIKKLYESARGCLSALRDEGYEQSFRSLSGEIPREEWKKVRVNPDDMSLAREVFQDAEVVPDENIAGGMIVSTADERIEVNNTLEKRLERYWPAIVPSIVKDIYERFDI